MCNQILEISDQDDSCPWLDLCVIGPERLEFVNAQLIFVSRYRAVSILARGGRLKEFAEQRVLQTLTLDGAVGAELIHIIHDALRRGNDVECNRGRIYISNIVYRVYIKRVRTRCHFEQEIDCLTAFQAMRREHQIAIHCGGRVIQA